MESLGLQFYDGPLLGYERYLDTKHYKHEFKVHTDAEMTEKKVNKHI